ncbi:hypothetical protein U1Q18_028198 [Sarracenia purpurea var. burkii]
MGLPDMLSVACARVLFSNLQRACGYQRLNPNELRAVMAILHFVCDKTIEANMPDLSNWESEAIMPNGGCRPVHATSCVYVDYYDSRHIKCIDTTRVRLVNPDLPERICTTLGIKKLSDVVVEKLDQAEPLQILEQIGSVPIVAIRQKLLNKSFQAALGGVVNSTEVAACSMPSYSLSSSSTVFGYYPYRRIGKEPIIPELDSGSRNQPLYSVDRPKTCILVDEPPTYISVVDIIAMVVGQVLGHSTPLPFGSLFLCPGDSATATANLLELLSEKRNGEKLKYGGIVEDVRPSAGQPLYRLKLGNAPATMLEDNHTVAENRRCIKDPEGSERGKSGLTQYICMLLETTILRSWRRG